jgi:hypothetical protein
VVDPDAALGEELFDVPVGQAEPQVPAHCQGDDLGRTGTRRRRTLAPGEGEGIGQIS